ncbi:MAG: hypothetical protein IPL08_13625 [Saprospiraceae bacterium]|nr:hypothetical protein [Saprospiraceae bacterium]
MLQRLFVEATLHVMVCIDPVAQDTAAVLGELNSRGPDVPDTVTAKSSEPIPPLVGLLSLAVSLKFNVLAVLGKASKVLTLAAVSIAERLGKVCLLPADDGGYDRE